MLNQENFIQRMYKIMEHYNLSAATFSDEINVQRSSISHLLSGRNKPSLEFVLKIVDHYEEVTLDWLLYGRNSFPTSQKNNAKDQEEKIISSPTQNRKDTALLIDKSQKKTTPSEIERIVVFYQNGTFKEYS
ncbi:MAG: helix-turn-helix transcriptional regulator [Wenyingzhuangia sp.]|uniref:helix-turn-helix domain-containing protein n=2 Tax=Wenyingzhuangia sp. TaxID=1964193 RepID=UPI00321AA3E4